MIGKSIVSPVVLIIMAVVAALGCIIMNKLVKRKWGYTPEREKELENIDETKYLR